MAIRRLMLDVLKPLREPSIVELANLLSSIPGVEGVNVSVNEVDVETLSLTVVLEGSNIPFDRVKEVLEKTGAVIHSVDQVVAGAKMVELPKSAEE